MTTPHRAKRTTMVAAAWVVSICWHVAAVAGAAETVFRRHDVDRQAAYNSCSAVDVNHDGRLDIVCGGAWYQAPHWQRHPLRDVEMIRGRSDDYSSLPLDVNEDGWVDFISVNYRSESLYWVQHPGPGVSGSPAPLWRKHEIDVPGAMETGRLADIDGDGQLDVLPNGVKFAAWWSVARQKTAAGEVQAHWERHDLPPQLAGHGIGFGDINGDGRGDLVGPRGWLEAPADRRNESWRWHPDFFLDRDCSIPILVYDVDGDGDSDLVWGRAHRIGLYWLEQRRSPNSAPAWTRHAIDTSWSQPHSILLADVDGDGRDEMVAGKRYMGHDGKDPGEFDPLVSYWYDFDSTTHSWRRGAISQEGPAAFGLDPKAVDLDADGDIDIVTADRSGLFWLENLPANQPLPEQAGGRTARSASPEYPSHAELLVYRDSSGALPPVDSAAEWAVRRSHILMGIEKVMGALPDPGRRIPLDVRTMETVETEHYLRHRITFAAEPDDRVPAYLLMPKNLRAPSPAMLCLHQTTRIGKDEPAGLGGRESLHYAHELAERGYVCIVPDYPSFGEYPYDFAAHNNLYASGSMKAIWNNIRAVDVLEALAEVDRDRIGCIGHSLGGHNSLFSAVFDQRIRAIVTSCGFTAFHHYYSGNLAGWTSDRYMPRIRQQYGNNPDKMPFDFYEVLGALAPRPVFVCAPLGDSNFEVEGVKKVQVAAEGVYKLLEAADKLEFVYPDSGHDFPHEVRLQVYRWLDRQLR